MKVEKVNRKAVIKVKVKKQAMEVPDKVIEMLKTPIRGQRYHIKTFDGYAIHFYYALDDVDITGHTISLYGKDDKKIMNMPIKNIMRIMTCKPDYYTLLGDIWDYEIGMI